MNEDFKPRAKRSLFRLSSFKEMDEDELLVKIPPFYEKIIGEGLIGVYNNEDDSIRSIIFSDKAVYFYSDDWKGIEYFDIDELVPDLDTLKPSRIGLLLKSGDSEVFYITGQDGKYRDYSTVYQFLHRILGGSKYSK